MARNTLAATAAAAAAALTLAAAGPAGAHGGPHGPWHGGGSSLPAGQTCSPDAALLGVSDQLDKTTYRGTDVGGLSALALERDGGWLDRALGRDRDARALVDNQGATPARLYDLALETRDRRGRDLGAPRVRVTGLTTLRRPDGAAFTGSDLDGEGLVPLSDGGFLAASETEPSIRRFDRRGRQVAELPVPERFRIAPDGEATRNQAFEGLGASADGRTLFAAMEGALSADGASASGGGLNRILRYEAGRRGGWALAGQLGYETDPGLNITEVQVVDDETLLVLERGFAAGAGNTIRVYQAFLAGADDVSGEASLRREGVRLVAKRLLVDLGDCPPGGARNPGRQANPLLDNVEAMALGERLPGGRRELLLLSDDNFSAGQVTRLYRLAVELRGEPVLEARATYDATRLQPGPTSGNVGVGQANGQVPPFAGQPVPGFSGVLWNRDGSFWGMPDNGFGTQANSRDFLLRLYHVRPQWASAWGGGGRLELDRFVSFRDPDGRVPFPIVNEDTRERLLTGGDFDIESIQRDWRGDLWVGEEFGPWLLHFDRDGKLLEAPIALEGVRAPQYSSEPTLQSSRGFEALAASRDGRTLYAIPEAALSTDADRTLRRIHEFDVRTSSYTGRTWTFHVAAENLQVGDAQVLPGNRVLMIERDDLEGTAARVKQIVEVDLDDAPQADGTLPRRVVLDLMRIRDPFGISTPAPAGGIGFGDPFSFPLQSVETVVWLGGDRLLVANDNNYPDSNGRVPGRPDDVEAIVVRVPGLADGR